jgi:Domain of unknown function (DUF6438)
MPYVRKLIFFPLVIGTLLACADRKGTAADQPTAQFAAESGLGGSTPADSLFLSLERTPCFGRCKSFRVNVYASGFATLEGRANLDLIGSYTTRLPQATLVGLLERCEEQRLWDLEDKYDPGMTDVPSIILQVVSAARSKRVVARGEYPDSFESLTKELETVLFQLPWDPTPKR